MRFHWLKRAVKFFWGDFEVVREEVAADESEQIDEVDVVAERGIDRRGM